MDSKFDLIVVGAGPGGYVAAIAAAQRGLQVALVEEREVGGTCLNRGCIPAKAMLHAAELYRQAREGAQSGVHAGEVTLDYAQVLAYKQETSAQLVGGIEGLLKANGVALINGRATVLAGKKVQVSGQIYEAESLLIATGSQPIRLPLPGRVLPGVLTCDDLFQLVHLPESLVIIGGGVIGVEFATALAAFGTRVTIVEAAPRLLAMFDKEISQSVKMNLKRAGVEIHTGAAVEGVSQEGSQLACHFTEKDAPQLASAQYVLCAVGRCANTAGLFEPGAAPEMERGRILINERFETSQPGVFAIGDATPSIQLAHVASAQGQAAASIIAGQEPESCLAHVPSCVYTSPEIASVGLTEEEAKAAGTPVQVGKFITSANGKSLITREDRGFVKVLAHAETGEILGAQMLCARATDMISEVTVALANHLTAADMQRALRPHPTYNEALTEALEALGGNSIHTAPRRRR